MPLVLPSTIHSPVTGAVIPAAWGTAVNDAIAYRENQLPHARVRRTGAPALTTAVRAALTFDAERVDVGATHSTVTNTERLVAPAGEGGWYLAGGHGEFPAGGSSGNRQLAIRVNGTTLIAVSDIPTNGIADVSLATAYQLNAGDYLELCALQTSGGAMSMNIAAAYSVEFWFMRQCA